MKPYYDQDGITIYHGDCRDFSPPSGSVVLADPPFGVRGRVFGDADIKRLDDVVGDDEKFDPAHLLAWDCPMVLWGANLYADALPAESGWLVWDKLQPDGVIQSRCELAWTNFVSGIRLHAERFRVPVRVHPYEKPEGLFTWIYGLRWFPDGAVVVDPYMGSGPSIAAASRAGIAAIGIEIEERYCEIAAKRLAQKVLF